MAKVTEQRRWFIEKCVGNSCDKLLLNIWPHFTFPHFLAILLIKPKGNIIETAMSEDGRWIIFVQKLDDSHIIFCNVYGYNSTSLSKHMFLLICKKIKNFTSKYENSHIIMGGDFNDASDDLVDRVPSRIAPGIRFKCTNFVRNELNLTDVWRFFNPNTKEYSWSNLSRTLKSRIDLWMISNQCVQFTKEIMHEYVPFTDHKGVLLHICGTQVENKNFRGYWKLNNNLLQDETFCKLIKDLANEIFSQQSPKPLEKWEYFKYKVREIGVKRSKELKQIISAKEIKVMEELNTLLNKTNINENEEVRITILKEEIDKYYIDLAKGAFIRSRCKWLENGEKNSSYFFALEKRNQKRNNIAKLNSGTQILSNPKDISKYVENFYHNIYDAKIHPEASESFIKSIKRFIPSVSENFKEKCEQQITRTELYDALKTFKKGKSPGNDGLSAEFYLHFWSTIEMPLFEAFKYCIIQNELSPTMKQGTICLIPKPEKDILFIENWRPITLLNVDYKIFASVFAKRLKTGLQDVISETQTGFMSNRHISSNIRLIFDLLDYSEYINSEALILFLDFYKAFDTIEHNFLFLTLQNFGFGPNFVSTVQMLYKNINSCVMLYPHTTSRFPVKRSVRQGCPLAPFLFLLTVELLSIYVKNSTVKGINIFNKEIKITQLADDTALFLSDKYQVSHAISLVQKFSEASGLQLNTSKCEILCLFDCNEKTIYNIAVKKKVKYLGILISKDYTERQQENFLPKLNKTKNILNLWTQRDTSIWGRNLLSKAEGISRFIYPALAMEITDKMCNEINTIFTNFIWKNKQHRLKKSILCNSKEEGGIEKLDFSVLNQTFKVKWIKQCLENHDSLWYFIPSHIFQKVGGLHFLLKCHYHIPKLPIKLSAFHKQALLSWKICYNHNFSPHKAIIWNNEDILKRNRTLFLPKWFEKNITFIDDLFDDNGQCLIMLHLYTNINFPYRQENLIL